MIQITLSKEILAASPDLHIIALSGKVNNSQSDQQLWRLITQEADTIKASEKIENINKWKPIQATRQVYKKLGKDPNRYRPSAEALRRRILRELPLYQIDTLVDIINLVSIRTGYSIGGFDAAKIQGDLILSVGKADDEYEAIGRGMMNIEGLPVYRDSIGGIGTPTSDEERTKITLDTSHLLMIINGYSGEEGILDAARMSAQLLRDFASAEKIDATLISAVKHIKIDL